MLNVLKGKILGMKDELDRVKDALEHKSHQLEEEQNNREKVPYSLILFSTFPFILLFSSFFYLYGVTKLFIIHYITYYTICVSVETFF